MELPLPQARITEWEAMNTITVIRYSYQDNYLSRISVFTLHAGDLERGDSPVRLAHKAVGGMELKV